MIDTSPDVIKALVDITYHREQPFSSDMAQAGGILRQLYQTIHKLLTVITDLFNTATASTDNDSVRG